MTKNQRIIKKWIEDVHVHIDKIKAHEATISKRQLLRILYQLGADAKRAEKEMQDEQPGN